MSEFLTGLVRDLERYADVGRALAEQSAYLRAMGNDVRLCALNAQIGASRLDEQGAALDAVGPLLTRQSQATSPLVATVAQLAASAVSEIEDMTFQLALSTIQAEMIAVFAHELAEEPEIHPTSASNMVGLADALQKGSNRTFAALTTVSGRLTDVVNHVGDVASGIDRLARLALNGRVELASAPDAGSISTLFSDVEKQVSDAKARLGEFEAIREAARDLEDAAGNDAMSAALRLRDHAQQLVPPK
jgi:hypothetical protein